MKVLHLTPTVFQEPVMVICEFCQVTLQVERPDEVHAMEGEAQHEMEPYISLWVVCPQCQRNVDILTESRNYVLGFKSHFKWVTEKS